MDSREELRRLLRADGILHASAGQPLVHRDGSHAPWAFYSWQVTLKERGLRLAAVNLLERLRKFKSTQLAAYGFTGQPLMNACVLLGGGRYTGLAVREQRKETVACRQVDGPLDRSRPVVLIDDSLSSGTSLSRGIHALEKDGFQVEGAVMLAYFPGRGGLEWAEAAGYHVEYLFDVWRDLGYPLEPGQRLGQMPSSTGISDASNPAVAARQIAEYFLSTGRVPKPPAGVDFNCGGQGGVFVSFRRRADDHRVARSGFWHFDPKAARPARDLVQATVLTLREAGGTITADNLSGHKIAVTFLGPLELIQPRDLDFNRYGIVVRSRTDPERMGGALPNTQVFTSEIAQYLHARDNNARLGPGEPHDLFRHTIGKFVEPDADWPPYGSEAPPEKRRAVQAFGDWLTGRAARIVRAVLEGREPELRGRAPPNSGSSHHFVALSLYQNGFLERGISGGQSPAADVFAAATEAAGKLRRRLRGKWRGPQPAVLVTLLHDPESYGYEAISHVARKLRAGLDALAGETEADRQILLPTALVHNNWSKPQFVTALGNQFRSSQDPVRWTGFKTTGWLRIAGKAARIRQGFVLRPPPAAFPNRAARDLAGEMGAYIFRHLDGAQIPDYYYDPMSDAHEPRGTAARAIHALDALGQAGVILSRREWVLAAHAGLHSFLKHIDSGQGGQLCAPDMEGGGLAECVLLAALARSGDEVLVNNPLTLALAQRVGGFFRPSGAISEFPESMDGQLHDYLPGAALLAMGRCKVAWDFAPLAGWRGHLEWCRRRFHHCPGWGMAGWLPQGWGELHQLMRDKLQAELVFEVADWALARQLSKNGAFLEELSLEEPSFNTGFIAEGIAAAWRTALRCRERARARRYEASWRAACAFVETLVIKPEDTFCMPCPEAAIGGVRTMASRCDVRIDQVSHGLHALAAGLDNLLRD
jgi:orotate phosphoribosyltransferase/AMMECR1 domain-containing protein